MLIACSKTLAAHSPLATRDAGGLLPPVEEIEMISRAIAAEVARGSAGWRRAAD
jgi:malate dehydrogenase (oxaloacetate-decarboxylating)